MSVPIDRSASLLLRVWLEDDDAFRARLTAVSPTDGRAPSRDIATAATREDVLTAVSAWLDDFLSGDGPGHDG